MPLHSKKTKLARNPMSEAESDIDDQIFFIHSAPNDHQPSGVDLSTVHFDESVREEVQEVQKLELEDTSTSSSSSILQIIPQPSALAVSRW